LPSRAEGYRHLAYARVLCPHIGVDRAQKPDLRLKARVRERIVIVIKAYVGTDRRLGVAAGISAFHRPHGVSRTRKRGIRQLRGMGITHGLLLDGAEAKSLVGIVGCLLEPAIVEDERLGLGIFKIKLAVIGTFNGVPEMAARIPAVDSSTLK